MSALLRHLTPLYAVLAPYLAPLLAPLRHSLAQTVAIALIAGGAAFLIGQTAIMAKVEQYTEDFRLPFGPKPTAPHPDIVVVGITEEVLDGFAYRSPVNRAFLAQLLRTLEAKHVRAIGLDVLFDRASDPEGDAALRDVLRSLSVPISVSYVGDERIVSADALQFLRAFVPPEARGMANVPTDEDGTVRWIFPGEKDSTGTYVPGLARAILARLGQDRPAGDLIPLRYLNRTVEGEEPIRKYPADLVAALPDGLLRDKIVLIGADLTLIDRHRTPFAVTEGTIEGNLPGVVIHAHGLAQLLDDTARRSFDPLAGAGLAILFGLIGTILGRPAFGVAIRVVLGGIVIVLLWAGAFALFQTEEIYLPLIAPTLALAISGWLTDAITGRQLRQQRNFIQGAMARYVSGSVVNELLRHPEKLSVTASRREMTYLFTDVAGFTSLAEAVGSTKLSQLLNQYLDGVCEEILSREGTVCRFIGDAVFALWNAPADQDDHAARAVSCALAIDAYAERFRQEQKLLGVQFGATRIGIHSGEAMVGNFGSAQRMEYTALGDNVNASSRLESLNKYFGTRIAVSEATVNLAGDRLRFRPIARVVVKGKTQPMNVFEPVDDAMVANGFLDRYLAAYRALEAGDPDLSIERFDALAQEQPDDPLVILHRDRLSSGIVSVDIVMSEK